MADALAPGAEVASRETVRSSSRAFIDLHCHTAASFDCLSRPADVVRAAASRGLTHLIVTDHDRIDGALAAREAAPAGLTVIIGEEVKTRDGDLICAYLERAIAPGWSAEETIAAAREQGGLVGIPHPFDRMRGSLLRDAKMGALAGLVDWVEVHNARLLGGGNETAAEFAHEHGLPGVAASDAHSILEIAVAYTALDGDPSTPAGLMAALASAELVRGRATFAVRAWTPVAKGIQRLRGNGRVQPAAGR
ncbi:MAG TPA: PHP domain-containing protein [Candidatus Saccharimonadales bacterium]|nr:PHP domain-containing protein [Candidatus Saccharimonadales bacterium]